MTVTNKPSFLRALMEALHVLMYVSASLSIWSLSASVMLDISVLNGLGKQKLQSYLLKKHLYRPLARVGGTAQSGGQNKRLLLS